MITITFTDFRNRASAVMDDVEKGEVVCILKHGKSIAEITPINHEDDDGTPSWKQPALRLSTKGIALSKAIQEERRA